MRIVSLLPSATEIVCALGLADALVGVSHDCDWPPQIRGRPVLSQAVVDAGLPSGAIDAAVRGQVHRGLSVYHLDAAALEALAPDLILTQELCAVCAPSYTEVRQAARLLEGRTRLVSLEPKRLDDILETIALVGDLTGAVRQARDVVLALRARIEQVRRLPRLQPAPRVVCLEWLDPPFVAGHWVPEMIEIAGGEPVLGTAGEPSRTVEWDDILAASLDVMILAPCGFDLPRARQEAAAVTGRPGWEALPAARTGRVYAVDASAYFNRPGPRVVRGLEIVAALLRAPGAAPDAPGTPAAGMPAGAPGTPAVEGAVRL